MCVDSVGVCSARGCVGGVCLGVIIVHVGLKEKMLDYVSSKSFKGRFNSKLPLIM